MGVGGGGVGGSSRLFVTSLSSKRFVLSLTGSGTFGLDSGMIAVKTIKENTLHWKYYVFLPQLFLFT